MDESEEEKSMLDSIDTESLIEEVKKRPGLWDNHSKDYNDAVARKTAWIDLFTSFFPNYEDFDDFTKTTIANDFHDKWSNLRSSYCRYLRDVRSAPEVSNKRRNKKKYYYADAMSFLNNYTTHKSSLTKAVRLELNPPVKCENAEGVSSGEPSVKVIKDCNQKPSMYFVKNSYVQFRKTPRKKPIAKCESTKSVSSNEPSVEVINDCNQNPSIYLDNSSYVNFRKTPLKNPPVKCESTEGVSSGEPSVEGIKDCNQKPSVYLDNSSNVRFGKTPLKNPPVKCENTEQVSSSEPSVEVIKDRNQKPSVYLDKSCYVHFRKIPLKNPPVECETTKGVSSGEPSVEVIKVGNQKSSMDLDNSNYVHSEKIPPKTTSKGVGPLVPVGVTKKRRITDEDSVMNFFKSLLPDTKSLSSKRKRMFKIRVLEILNELMDDQENESVDTNSQLSVEFSYSHVEDGQTYSLQSSLDEVY